MPPSTFSACQLDPRICVHRVNDLATLPRGRLERRPGDVSGVDEAREPGDHAACLAAPVRGEQTGEGRYEVHPAVVLDRECEFLDLGRGLDHLQVVAQPLHERTGDRDRAFQHVGGRLVADLVADARDEAVLRLHRFRAGVQQQERAGAVGVLRLARRRSRSGRTAPPAGRRGRQRPARRPPRRPPRRRPGSTIGSRAASTAARRSRRAGRRPNRGSQVHQHRAARVGHVGHVLAAVRRRR